MEEPQVFSQETERRYALITRDLQEVLGGDELKKILEVRDPVMYFGTEPTNTPHFAYLTQIIKIRDALNAGCDVIVLIADLHAFLNGAKSSLENVSTRTEFYTKIFKVMLQTLNVDLTKVRFVKGSDFQLQQNYTLDVYKMASKTNVTQCKHAGTEVVKQSKDAPLMTNLLYPSLQALDMVYLGAEIFLGGTDQRKLNTFATENLPKIGYTDKKCYLMTPMISAIRTKKQSDPTIPKTAEEILEDDIANKMSASNVSSKIDLLATPETIRKIISKAYLLDGDADDNSLLQLVKNLLFKLTDTFPTVKYNNETKACEPSKVYTSYEELHADVALGSANGGIHPADFKQSLSDFLIDFLKPIRDDFDNDDGRELLQRAYG